MPNSDMTAAELDRPPSADQTEIRMLSPSGILGYGFPEHCLDAGMRQKPHLIAVDGGSSDPGPHYLGSGDAFVSRLSMRRDIRLMPPRGALWGSLTAALYRRPMKAPAPSNTTPTTAATMPCLVWTWLSPAV